MCVLELTAKSTARTVCEIGRVESEVGLFQGANGIEICGIGTGAESDGSGACPIANKVSTFPKYLDLPAQREIVKEAGVAAGKPCGVSMQLYVVSLCRYVAAKFFNPGLTVKVVHIHVDEERAFRAVAVGDIHDLLDAELIIFVLAVEVGLEIWISSVPFIGLSVNRDHEVGRFVSWCHEAHLL